MLQITVPTFRHLFSLLVRVVRVWHLRRQLLILFESHHYCVLTPLNDPLNLVYAAACGASGPL